MSNYPDPGISEIESAGNVIKKGELNRKDQVLGFDGSSQNHVIWIQSDVHLVYALRNIKKTNPVKSIYKFQAPVLQFQPCVTFHESTGYTFQSVNSHSPIFGKQMKDNREIQVIRFEGQSYTCSWNQPTGFCQIVLQYVTITNMSSYIGLTVLGVEDNSSNGMMSALFLGYILYM